MWKILKRTCIYILIILILSSCSLSGPEVTVKKFLKAQEVNDFTTMASLVVPELQEDVVEWTGVTMGLSALIGGAEFEYKHLKIQTVSSEGDQALVRVQGELEGQAMGVPLATPIEYTLPLIKQNGKWLITYTY